MVMHLSLQLCNMLMRIHVMQLSTVHDAFRMERRYIDGALAIYM